MDAKDICNLSEAYREVYASPEELDEGREGFRFEYNKKHGRPLIDPITSKSASSKETLGGGTYYKGPQRLPKSKRKYDRQVLSGVRAASEQEKERARKRMGIKEDIYDIILSHLLDEGYAKTPKAAEAIMVNMSEEWRDSIREFILECEFIEGKVEWDNPKRHLPSGLTPREKNRAKRISTDVENPNIKPSEKQLERYGKLKIAHDTEKGKKVPRNKRHRFSQFNTGPIS